MGFHRVGQVGLKLLASSDPPISASQNAGIIGVRATAPSQCDFLYGLGKDTEGSLVKAKTVILELWGEVLLLNPHFPIIQGVLKRKPTQDKPWLSPSLLFFFFSFFFLR